MKLHWLIAGAAIASSQIASAQAPCPIELSGVAPTLTVDGVLLQRYARDLRGNALTANVAPSRNLSNAQATIANNAATRLDLNGSGGFDTNDSTMFSRHLAGFATNLLGAGLTFPGNALRPDGASAAAFLYQGCPTSDFANKSDAARFLMQASFGPTRTSIDEVLAKTGTTALQKYARWIDDQWALPPTRITSYIDGITGEVIGRDLTYGVWHRAIRAPDQLRQRCMFALSQFFVVSRNSNLLANAPRGLALYLDKLQDGCDGNFRTVLEDVSRSPMMGLYLSHIRNQKEDPLTGAVPDENYAREIMQLFTIGLIELNENGTPKLDQNGNQIETYDNNDVTALAKVFTGWGPHDPVGTRPNSSFNQGNADVNTREFPMDAYPQFHSTSAKAVLSNRPAGLYSCPPIAAQTTANAPLSLQRALDCLFNHPNTPPFVVSQLIKRMVTSNPSQQYVQDVVNVFKNNGSGVRGDMRATVKALLLHSEARKAGNIVDPKFGKVREPVIRVAHLIRALDIAPLTTGVYYIESDWSQTPINAPSVFNFYRPGYFAAGSQTAAAGLSAPELQITSETTNAIYVNRVEEILRRGIRSGDYEVLPTYTYANTLYSQSNPDPLIHHLNLVLLAGQMSPDLYRNLRADIAVTRSGSNTADNLRYRISGPALLIAASLEFIVQK